MCVCVEGGLFVCFPPGYTVDNAAVAAHRHVEATKTFPVFMCLSFVRSARASGPEQEASSTLNVNICRPYLKVCGIDKPLAEHRNQAALFTSTNETVRL